MKVEKQKQERPRYSWADVWWFANSAMPGEYELMEADILCSWKTANEAIR